MGADAAIAAIATTQHGLVTRVQALGAGVSPRMIHQRTRHGRWVVERRGVYAIAGSPILSPARTIVACSGRVPPWRLGAVVDDALRRGLVSLHALRKCHERVATGPGRRHTVALREVLADRGSGYAPGDSEPEAELVRLLTSANLPAPALGHRVDIGRWRYRLDIAWPEALLALEHDGWDTHRTFTAFHGDRQRVRRLTAAGWTILPVTAQTDRIELLRDVTSVLSSRLMTA